MESTRICSISRKISLRSSINPTKVARRAKAKEKKERKVLKAKMAR